MKKILFTLLLVVGSFAAQAQDTINITHFVHGNGNTYANFRSSEFDSGCYENYTDVLNRTFVYDAGAGTLVIMVEGAATIGPLALSPGQRALYPNAFAANQHIVIQTNANRSRMQGAVPQFITE